MAIQSILDENVYFKILEIGLPIEYYFGNYFLNMFANLFSNETMVHFNFHKLFLLQKSLIIFLIFKKIF